MGGKMRCRSAHFTVLNHPPLEVRRSYADLAHLTYEVYILRRLIAHIPECDNRRRDVQLALAASIAFEPRVVKSSS